MGARYGLLVSDLWDKEIHCGSRMKARIDGDWIETRMEMRHPGEIWYLIDTGLSGEALEGLLVEEV